MFVGIYKGKFTNPTYKTTSAVFQLSALIPRKDFNIGLTYRGAMLGEVVKLESTVELIMYFFQRADNVI